MTYPLSFRQKVFAVKLKKRLTYQETSEHFDVGIRTLFRWENNMEPCVTRNKPATKIDRDDLICDVEEHPDDFQWERAERFGVSPWGIGLALKRLNITYKKTLQHPKAKEEVRIDFQERIKGYENEGKTHRVFG